MKVLIENDIIILYLYNYYFENDDKEYLTKEIKKIFLKLIKYYYIEMNGFYEVNIYENIKYGVILEIILKDKLLFRSDFIDIKVNLFKNKNMYFKTKDYFILNNYQNIYYHDNYYYIDIQDIDDILKVIEFGELVYKEKEHLLNKMIFIQ